MKPTLPIVLSKASISNAFLHLWRDQHHQQIQLDTSDWFAFLAQDQAFRFSYHLPDATPLHLTIRPKKRAQGTYWYAYHTCNGNTNKKYLASSAKLSKAKLEAVAQSFAQDLLTQNQADPTLSLYAAVDDLAWLAQRLLEQCPQPELVTFAQRELARIQRHIRA